MKQVYDPVCTYRVQLNKDFTFNDLERIIPYLSGLGIRTIYASPVFHAPPGSMHGYDGVNPNEINPEIGSEEQLVRINKELKEKNIGWLQDIVPNHLSYHQDNTWLMDVLKKGKESEYADIFDIDWNHPQHPQKLMVPFPGSPLEEILKKTLPSAEHYVLCPWQETDHTINYRRFFTVNNLICVNIHQEHVFKIYHALIRKLTREGIFSGLRVDHVDGLYDPKKYLEQLRDLAGEKAYLTVEKILEPHETLPTDWPVQGSSGYDFLGMVNNLFTNKKSQKALTEYYDGLTRNSTPVSEQIRQKKTYMLLNHMGGELDNLCRLYKNLGLADELTDTDIRNSIAGYLVSCPVYRYYGNDIPVMARDRDKNKEALQTFYSRAMQFTGPLMAKGVEDTLMYTYNRFIGHNEVGDSPEVFGYSTDEFHDLMEDRLKNWPMSMNATSTHDTKRGEDARARLNVISDLFSEWISLADQWRKENLSLRANGQPDENDEYFIYQTLVATYPVNEAEEESYPSRLGDYLQKALREAKTHSSWSEPDTEYEQRCKDFAGKLIDKKGPFRNSFDPFLAKVRDFGMVNSFGQMILKFTCPGVPDLYQGTEFWDLSMVDPDNRRPVDYSLRREMSGSQKSLADLWPSRHSGQIKLVLTEKLLWIRNRFADLFIKGKYVRLQTTGHYAQNIFAFIREYENRRILSLVPLHLTEVVKGSLDKLTGIDWKDTRVILPGTDDGKWKDLLQGKTVNANGHISLNEILQDFPAAVLVNE